MHNSACGKEGNALKHLEKKKVPEVAGMELCLEEKRKTGIGVQGSFAAGFLPQLLCAQG